MRRLVRGGGAEAEVGARVELGSGAEISRVAHFLVVWYNVQVGPVAQLVRARAS